MASGESIEKRFFRSPWSGWYATQESLTTVTIYSKLTDESHVIERPMEWGDEWGWNISPDGTGIVMTHWISD